MEAGSPIFDAEVEAFLRSSVKSILTLVLGCWIVKNLLGRALGRPAHCSAERARKVSERTSPSGKGLAATDAANSVDYWEAGTGKPKSGHFPFVNVSSEGPGGRMCYSNAAESTFFDCGVCHGRCLILHKPTQDPACVQSGSYPYAEHMHGRRRLWEFRVQVTFRENIEGDVFFGLEQDRYYRVPKMQRMAAMPLISAIRHAAKGIYQSYGDNPEKTEGECERPSFVFPLWTMDQLIVTPEGEKPPSLSDSAFPSMGMTKSSDREAFKEAITAMKFRRGSTVTMAFWSPAQFCDVICWKGAKVPLLPEVKFSNIGIHPPCYFAMYTLKPSSEWGDARAQKDGRHLDSRKIYMLHMAYWSLVNPPDRERINELMHISPQRETENVVPEPQTSWTFCCTARTKT